MRRVCVDVDVWGHVVSLFCAVGPAVEVCRLTPLRFWTECCCHARAARDNQPRVLYCMLLTSCNFGQKSVDMAMKRHGLRLVHKGQQILTPRGPVVPW